MKRDLVLVHILFKYVFARKIGIKRGFEQKDSRTMMIKMMMMDTFVSSSGVESTKASNQLDDDDEDK